MAKVYLIGDKDLDLLLTSLDRDPQWGERGGSSRVLTPEERRAHEEAHRFFNFQVRHWVEEVRR